MREEQRYDDAEKLERDVLEEQRLTLGPEHASTLLTLGNLGFVLIEEKKYSEAEQVLREALAGLRPVLGPSHEVTANAALNLARVLALEGKRNDAFVPLRAFMEGISDLNEFERLEKDDKLQSLHADRRFDAFLSATRQRIAAAPAPSATK